MTYFIVGDDGQFDGPFSVPELRASAESGGLVPTVMLEAAESRLRVSAGSVPGLFDGVSEPAPVSRTGFFKTTIAPDPEPTVSAPTPPTSEPFLPPGGPPPMGPPPLHQPFASYPRMANVI